MKKKTKSKDVKDACFPLGGGFATVYDVRKVLVLNTEMMERIEELEKKVRDLERFHGKTEGDTE
jgi:hypothetical protein